MADLKLGEAFQAKIVATQKVLNSSYLPKPPKRPATAHKGNIGLLLTIGGNEGMPGAIRLASESALRAGASLVSVCCHQNNQMMVVQGRPELMLASDEVARLKVSQHFSKAKVLLCGPGLGQNSWSRSLFDLVVQTNKPAVIDADGLNLLSNHPTYRDDWVLTPHPGEAAKLLHCTIEQVEKDRFTAVSNIVAKYGGVCVLKGAGTLICDGKETWINTTGNSGMATGGMGDVLSGIIAALLLQTNSPLDAVRLAVYIHGKAADNVAEKNGKIGLLASDLFSEIQQLVNS